MNHSLKTVLIDLTPIKPGGENGGAKLVIFELLTSLAKLAPSTQFILLAQEAAYEELRQFEQQQNISCRVVNRSLGKKSFFARGIGYMLRKLPRIPARWAAWGYRLQAHTRRRAAQHILQHIKPDLLFCPLTAPTYRIPGVPTVCTIHDVQFKTYPMFFDLPDLLHREQTFAEACKHSTLLAAVSEYSRQSVLQHSALNPEKVFTIHSRLAGRMLERTQDKAILKRLGLISQQYFIYPANYWLHKNHEILLTAFNLACHRADFPSTIKLVCTGSTSERQRWLQQAAEQMGLSARVLFTDYLTDSELGTLMQHSCGMVFPSLYEGFGLPVLEAMAAQIPVACSNTRSLPEVAGDAAYFFDPRIPEQIAEALVVLATDPSTRQRLVQKGQARATLFSDTKQMAAEYWHVFQKAHDIHHNEKIA